jgi:hypothetical protein
MNPNFRILTFLSVLFAFLTSSISAQPAIQWQKALGGTNVEEATSLQPTKDGGLIVAGWSNSNDGDVSGNHGGYDCWIVKLDPFGMVQWQKNYGGSGNDEAWSVQLTNDGGYIVAGRTNSNDGDVSGNHGDWDCWIVKLDSVGTIQWQKSLGGSGADQAADIQSTSDGGYIVAGGSLSNDGDVSGNYGNGDLWVVKLNDIGEIQWQECLGGGSSEYANSIRSTIDGGYIVAGATGSDDGDVAGSSFGGIDEWIIKLSSDGAIQWQKCLGGEFPISGVEGDDQAADIQLAGDGGYIVAGYTNSNDWEVSGNHGVFDAWVVKLDSTGTIQWQKCLGGSKLDVGTYIQPTSDAGYIMSGYTSSNDGEVSGNHGGYFDAWVVKLDNTGAIQWQKCLGGSNGDKMSSLYPTPDGGYFMAGYSSSSDGDVSGNHGNADFWVIKLSPVTAVQDNLNESGCTLYPNPAIDYVQVKMDDSNSNIQVTLFDVLGRQVRHQQLETGENINVSTLAPSVYIVKILTSEGKAFEKKIVKQ